MTDVRVSRVRKEKNVFALTISRGSSGRSGKFGAQKLLCCCSLGHEMSSHIPRGFDAFINITQTCFSLVSSRVSEKLMPKGEN